MGMSLLWKDEARRQPVQGKNPQHHLAGRTIVSGVGHSGRVAMEFGETFTSFKTHSEITLGRHQPVRLERGVAADYRDKGRNKLTTTS